MSSELRKDSSLFDAFWLARIARDSTAVNANLFFDRWNRIEIEYGGDNVSIISVYLKSMALRVRRTKTWSIIVGQFHVNFDKCTYLIFCEMNVQISIGNLHRARATHSAIR